MTRRAAVLVAAALAFAGCDDSKPPAQPAAKAAPAEKPKGPVSTRPLTPAWPAAAQGKGDPASSTVSGDLFARNYYVVLDASGSMTEKGCSGDLSKMDAARNALALSPLAQRASRPHRKREREHAGDECVGHGHADRVQSAVRGTSA